MLIDIKSHFLNLVKNKLDITFSNEQEILSLVDTKNFDEVYFFSKNLGKLIIITRGEKGSIVIKKMKFTSLVLKKI